eukprot:4526-Heterococcus_DN1.PRE.4
MVLIFDDDEDRRTAVRATYVMTHPATPMPALELEVSADDTAVENDLGYTAAAAADDDDSDDDTDESYLQFVNEEFQLPDALSESAQHSLEASKKYLFDEPIGFFKNMPDWSNTSTHTLPLSDFSSNSSYNDGYDNDCSGWHSRTGRFDSNSSSSSSSGSSEHSGDIQGDAPADVEDERAEPTEAFFEKGVNLLAGRGSYSLQTV